MNCNISFHFKTQNDQINLHFQKNEASQNITNPEPPETPLSPNTRQRKSRAVTKIISTFEILAFKTNQIK